MDKITFDDYKNAVRNQFEISKVEDPTGILLDPTPASFRDYCLMIYEKGLSASDESAFMRFFEVEEKEHLRKGIEQFNTGKLKAAIEFFDQAKKNTQKKSAVELCAVLCNFKPRPYAQFIKLGEKSGSAQPPSVHTLEEISIDTEKREEERKPPIQVLAIPDDAKANTLSTEPQVNLKDNALDTPGKKELLVEKKTNRIWEKSKKYIAISLLVITTAIVAQVLNRQPKCLTWSNDHYELVDCEGDYPIVPYREKLLEFKKITVSDTTTFFKNGQPIVWYSKQNNDFAFFNAAGENPITGKELRPISRYIIENHIRKNKPY